MINTLILDKKIIVIMTCKRKDKKILIENIVVEEKL